MDLLTLPPPPSSPLLEGPSLFMMRMSRMGMVLYDKIDPRAKEFTQKVDISSIPKLINDSYEEAVQLSANKFDSIPIDELIAKTPSDLLPYLEYIHSFFPKNCLGMVTKTWPPSVPQAEQSVMQGFFMLIQIAHACKDPIKFLGFVSNSLSAKISDTCQDNHIIAFARFTRGDSDAWAVVDSEKVFHTFLLNAETDSFSIPIEAKVGSIIITDQTINVMGESAEQITSFVPNDSSQLQLWGTIMSNSHAQLPLFDTTFEEPAPRQVIDGLSETISSDDLKFVHTLLDPKILPLDEGQTACKALLDIFSYKDKVPQLIATVVGSAFEDPMLTATNFLEAESHLSNFFTVFSEKYAQSYVDSFLKKLFNFIKANKELGLSNLKTCNSVKAEQFVSSVVKLITKSLSYVPMELRHIISVIKSFASSRFNSRLAVFSAISHFFFSEFLREKLMEMARDDEEASELCQKIFTPLDSILQRIFELRLMGGEFLCFNSWNDRLEMHIFPSIEEFAFALTDVNAAGEYGKPTEDDFIVAVSEIASEVSNLYEQFITKYKDNSYWKSPIGWNLWVIVTSFFVQSTDSPNERTTRFQLQKNRAKAIEDGLIPSIGSISSLEECPLSRKVCLFVTPNKPLAPYREEDEAIYVKMALDSMEALMAAKKAKKKVIKKKKVTATGQCKSPKKASKEGKKEPKQKAKKTKKKETESTEESPKEDNSSNNNKEAKGESKVNKKISEGKEDGKKTSKKKVSKKIKDPSIQKEETPKKSKNPSTKSEDSLKKILKSPRKSEKPPIDSEKPNEESKKGNIGKAETKHKKIVKKEGEVQEKKPTKKSHKKEDSANESKEE